MSAHSQVRLLAEKRDCSKERQNVTRRKSKLSLFLSPYVVALARLSSLQQRQRQRQQFGIGGDVACGSRRQVLAGREDVKSAIGRVRQPAGGSGGSGGSSGGGNPDGGGELADFAEKEERTPASETVEPTAAFDVASLVLYGSRALPIRLKILLDQLFNQLPHAQVTRLLAAFGWTHEDYTRGYILQVSLPS